MNARDPEASPAAVGARGGLVLVTGASGFLGRHVCARLARAGMPVRALSRGSAFRMDGVEVVPTTDIADGAALDRALEGVDTVLHLAGRAHVPARGASAASELRRVNTGGTEVLLEAAARANVRTFVLASSVKAAGEATPPGMCWDESVTPAPQDAYGVSKLEAERRVRVAAEQHGFWAPVLRLPLVYGAGMRANMMRLFRLVDRGVPLPFGGVRNRRSLVFAENASAAIEAVMTGPAGRSEIYFVSDGRDLPTPELIELIAQALGRKARLVRAPRALLAGAARVGDLLGHVVPVPFDTESLQRLLGSLAVDIRKIVGAGYAPPFTVEQGLAATAAWYRGAR